MDVKDLSIKYSGHLCWGNGLNIWKIKSNKDVVWPCDEALNELFKLFHGSSFESLLVVQRGTLEIRIAIPQATAKATLKALVAVIASKLP